MRLSLIALPFILISACAQEDSRSAHVAASADEAGAADPAPTVTAAPPPPPASTLAPVETLTGEWRVAGIDGAQFDEPYGLALSGDDSSLWWAPRCARQERRYVIKGQDIRFAPPPEMPGSPACLPGLPARLADVLRALDAASRVGRTSSNGIEISGGGHSVLLFSQ